MPEVSRLSGTVDSPEGFRVVTESGGSTYEYDLRRTDDPDDEDTEFTVAVAGKTVDGEPAEPEATEAVREALNERGVQVAE